jgi:hypothetical protein
VAAQAIYDLMLAYKDMTITAGVATVCFGAASRYLGMLSATLGDFEKAADHFEHALEMNAASGARPWRVSGRHHCCVRRRCPGRRISIRMRSSLARPAAGRCSNDGVSSVAAAYGSPASQSSSEPSLMSANSGVEK